MNYFQKILDIRSTSDPRRAIDAITEGVSIRGYNMWLLFCSAALASIGLDTNSTAVIIGAMLISPLMSPILGVGLSIGIHDRTLLVRSLRNLAAAVLLSLFASALYFTASPFAYPTAEIEARTYPTLLDVGVALFGGIAGIVSASRSGSSIAIPGVAIATALMPPLCTAGYGLATMQWRYFGGAFYLFFINAAFISLATFVIVKYLRFPEKEFATKKQRNRYSILFGILTFLVTLPSIYFLYTVYQKETVRKKLNNIVLEPLRREGNEILKWELSEKDSAVWIKVYHTGHIISDSLKNQIRNNLILNDLDRYEFKPLRVNMTREEVNALSAEVSKQMFQELQLQIINEQKERRPDTLSFLQVGNEIRVAFPFIDTSYAGWLTIPGASAQASVDTLPVVFYKSRSPLNTAQGKQFYEYLNLRLPKDTVVLVRQ